jgi:hypothetical protein
LSQDANNLSSIQGAHSRRWAFHEHYCKRYGVPPAPNVPTNTLPRCRRKKVAEEHISKRAAGNNEEDRKQWVRGGLHPSKGSTPQTFQGLLLERQGQNQALAVLNVQYSLGSGPDQSIGQRLGAAQRT